MSIAAVDRYNLSKRIYEFAMHLRRNSVERTRLLLAALDIYHETQTHASFPGAGCDSGEDGELECGDASGLRIGSKGAVLLHKIYYEIARLCRQSCSICCFYAFRSVLYDPFDLPSVEFALSAMFVHSDFAFFARTVEFCRTCWLHRRMHESKTEPYAPSKAPSPTVSSAAASAALDSLDLWEVRYWIQSGDECTNSAAISKCRERLQYCSSSSCTRDKEKEFAWRCMRRQILLTLIRTELGTAGDANADLLVRQCFERVGLSTTNTTTMMTGGALGAASGGNSNDGGGGSGLDVDVDVVACAWAGVIGRRFDLGFLQLFAQRVVNPCFAHPEDFPPSYRAEVVFLYASYARACDFQTARIDDVLEKAEYVLHAGEVSLEQPRPPSPSSSLHSVHPVGVHSLLFGIAFHVACIHGTQGSMDKAAQALLECQTRMLDCPKLLVTARLDWHLAMCVIGQLLGYDVSDHVQIVHSSFDPPASDTAAVWSSLCSTQRQHVLSSLANPRVSDAELAVSSTCYPLIAQRMHESGLSCLESADLQNASMFLSEASRLAKEVGDVRLLAACQETVQRLPLRYRSAWISDELQMAKSASIARHAYNAAIQEALFILLGSVDSSPPLSPDRQSVRSGMDSEPGSGARSVHSFVRTPSPKRRRIVQANGGLLNFTPLKNTDYQHLLSSPLLNNPASP
eukprot:ANDGO_01213.mRNA.1 hypothetical protein